MRDDKLTRESTGDGRIGPECFINRELSWLEFNLRVLEEAENPENPLMERLKFLAIFSSNLDEFFMVRVAGLREQAFGESAPQDYSADGMSAIEQLKAVAKRTQDLVARQYRCLRESIGPAMVAEGFRPLRHDVLDGPQREHVDQFFRDRVLPILTPMAVDPAHPSPRYHNRGLYLGVMLEHSEGLGPKRLFAVVQVPQVLPRIISVPSSTPGTAAFVLLEDVVAARLPELFGGFRVQSWTSFRITRDSDLELLEQESDDMLRLIEDRLKARQRGQAVRIEIASKADETLAHAIISAEDLHDGTDDGYSEVYRIDGPLDLTALWELYRLPGYERLHDKPFTPRLPRGLGRRGGDLFAAIAAHDILLHHPYDSFDPVVDFVTSAASDPRVLAIKQTLYRTSGDSPISRALIAAAESGKQVTALVELKARFDEANNVSWARQMERAGVHVVFGFLDLKTHCKVSMVVRNEGQRLRRYVHLGTGNYNPTTAVHRRRGDRRGRLGAVQPADGLRPGACLAEAGGRAQRPAPADAGTDRGADATGAGRSSHADLRQAQRPRGPHGDRGALPGQPGRRADRHRGPRHLLAAAGRAGPQRDDPRAQHRRPVPGTQPHLRVRPRRGCPRVPGERRLDAAELLPARGTDVPGAGARPGQPDPQGDPAALPHRQHPGPAARRGRHVPPAASGARRAGVPLPDPDARAGRP
jgi:hypothetical protein